MSETWSRVRTTPPTRVPCVPACVPIACVLLMLAWLSVGHRTGKGSGLCRLIRQALAQRFALGCVRRALVRHQPQPQFFHPADILEPLGRRRQHFVRIGAQGFPEAAHALCAVGGVLAHGLVLGRVTGKGGAPPIAQEKSVTRAGLVAGADRGSPHIGYSVTTSTSSRKKSRRCAGSGCGC